MHRWRRSGVAVFISLLWILYYCTDFNTSDTASVALLSDFGIILQVRERKKVNGLLLVACERGFLGDVRRICSRWMGII